MKFDIFPPRKSVEKFQVSLKPDKKKRGTLLEDIFIFMTVSRWILFRMRYVSNKSCRGNRNIRFLFCPVIVLSYIWHITKRVTKLTAFALLWFCNISDIIKQNVLWYWLILLCYGSVIYLTYVYNKTRCITILTAFALLWFCHIFDIS